MCGFEANLVHAGVEGADAAATGGVESVINQSAVDLLRRLPGVTEANFRPLMAAAGSLAGLADMALPDLATAMGSQASARKLREWLDAVCPIQR
jgi:DNA excision repair protein ERCC-4